MPNDAASWVEGTIRLGSCTPGTVALPISQIPPPWLEQLIYLGRPRRQIHGIEDTGRLRRLHLAALLFWGVGGGPFAVVVSSEAASTATAIAIYAAIGPVLGLSLLIASKYDRLLGLTPLTAIVWVLMLGNVSDFYLQGASMVAIVLGATFVAWMGTEVAIPYAVATIGGVFVAGTLAGDVYLFDRVVLVALSAAFLITVLGKQSDEIHQMANDREVLLARLAHESRHDNLTELGNRAHLVDEISYALADAAVNSVGLALIDLDHFKTINDTYGHLVGDDVLIQVGDRLRAVCGPSETPIRIGGDEFAVIVRDPSESAAELAARFEAAVRWSWMREESAISVAASVGAAVCARELGTLEDLFSAADEAMYQRKAIHHATQERAVQS